MVSRMVLLTFNLLSKKFKLAMFFYAFASSKAPIHLN